MTNTTTQHIRALLADDGHEFAMIRKTDLAALMQVCEGLEGGVKGYFAGRAADQAGALMRRVRELEVVTANDSRVHQKHGEERRRYMANNKALLASVDQKDFVINGYQMLLRQKESYTDEVIQLLIGALDREAVLAAKSLRVKRFKRKFPSIGALMDMTP